MRAFLTACAIVALPACSTLADLVTIKVPVSVPCDPPTVDRPALPVDALTGSEDVFQVARALWATDELREGYEVRLRASVDGCRSRK